VLGNGLTMEETSGSSGLGFSIRSKSARKTVLSAYTRPHAEVTLRRRVQGHEPLSVTEHPSQETYRVASWWTASTLRL
jgi:hypothetical protein